MPIQIKKNIDKSMYAEVCRCFVVGAETFGRTYIANAESSVSSTADGHALTFTAAVTRRRTSSREELVPADVLGKLPNCEFFAALAGGKLVKGRIPILID